MIISEIKYYIRNGGDEEDFGHNDTNEQTKGNYVSLTISCLMLIMSFLFLILVFHSWLRQRRSLKIDERCMTYELYNGIRKVPKRCLYEMKEDKTQKQKTENEETHKQKDEDDEAHKQDDESKEAGNQDQGNDEAENNKKKLQMLVRHQAHQLW